MTAARHTPAQTAHRRQITAAATAAIVLVSLTACAAEPAGQLAAQLQSSTQATATEPASSSNYSLTQIVQNNSDVPLTLQGEPIVDNNATVQAGYPTTIQPKTAGSYQATNKGNGVQMWLHFSTPDGAAIVVDSDVPKVNGNKFDHKITGPGVGFDDSKTYIDGGDNPKAQVTIDSCTHGCTTEANSGGIIS
jgi:hypothetical protein